MQLDTYCVTLAHSSSLSEPLNVKWGVGAIDSAHIGLPQGQAPGMCPMNVCCCYCSCCNQHSSFLCPDRPDQLGSPFPLGLGSSHTACHLFHADQLSLGARPGAEPVRQDVAFAEGQGPSMPCTSCEAPIGAPGARVTPLHRRGH